MSFILRVFVALVFTIPIPGALGFAGDVSHPSKDSSMRVSVTEVERIKTDEVKLQITLKNESDHDLYLPTYGSREPIYIKTISVYQWDSDKGWRQLGSGSELPPHAVMRLHPGQDYTLVRYIHDPTVPPGSGEGIPTSKAEPAPLRVMDKVTVGFYESEEEWQAYRDYVESFSRKAKERKKPSPPPKLTIAESNEFEIPRPKS